jgi:hypothetical protein
VLVASTVGSTAPFHSETSGAVPGHEDVLGAAFDIDDLGRITRQAFDDETGTFVAFLATPMRR